MLTNYPTVASHSDDSNNPKEPNEPNVDPELVTKEAMVLFKWAKVVLGVRREVKELGRTPFSSYDRWERLEALILGGTAPGSEDSAIFSARDFAEFGAVRGELTFQRKLHAAAGRLEAHVSRMARLGYRHTSKPYLKHPNKTLFQMQLNNV